MEYVGLVFGIFGLMAYLSVSSLKNRVSRLERELQAMQGNNYSLERASLAESLKSRIGEPVLLTFREDEQDIDCMMLGRKTGAITLLDTDGEWALISIEKGKEKKQKLIRVTSVRGVSN